MTVQPTGTTAAAPTARAAIARAGAGLRGFSSVQSRARDDVLEAAWDEAVHCWQAWRDLVNGVTHWCVVFDQQDLHGNSGSCMEDAIAMAKQDAVEALRELLGLVIGQ